MKELTASLAAAHGAIRRVLEVTSDIANLRVDQSLVGEVLAVEMFSAPEATSCNSATLSTFGDGTWCS